MITTGSNPEMPFLAAGTVAMLGGIARNKSWPANGSRAVVATIAMVTVASASKGTKIEPLVRAIGLLVLMTAVIMAVPYFNGEKSRTKKKR